MTQALVALQTAGLSVSTVDDLIRRALAEDLGVSLPADEHPPGSAGPFPGVDVTTVATVPAGQRAVMDIVARQPGVVAGLPVAARVFELAGEAAQPAGEAANQLRLDVAITAADGQPVAPGEVLLTITGPARTLLLAERTALNLACHLSGIATATAAWVEALRGTGARVRDTRKTTPGLRALEKYAVRCGGGVNHRMGLWDAALVKDNHVVAAGGIEAAFRAVRERFPGVPVEVEVDSLSQLEEVVAAGADLVLLDNFDVAATSSAVTMVAGRCRLESSGGLTLASASQYAATGVDFIAVGALTHSASVLDLAAELRPAGQSPDLPAQTGGAAPDRPGMGHDHGPHAGRH